MTVVARAEAYSSDGGQVVPPPPPASRQPRRERHNFQITNDNLGVGGEKTKYQYNVAAIRTLKQIEAEGRLATPEEIGRIQNFQADNIMFHIYTVDFDTLSVHSQLRAHGDFISGLQPLTVCRHLRNGV